MNKCCVKCTYPPRGVRAEAVRSSPDPAEGQIVAEAGDDGVAVLQVRSQLILALCDYVYYEQISLRDSRNKLHATCKCAI